MTTTPDALFAAIKANPDDIEQVENLMLSLWKAAFEMIRPMNLPLIKFCWPYLVELIDIKQSVILNWLVKFLGEISRLDSQGQYTSQTMELLLRLLDDESPHVISTAYRAMCQLIPRSFEWIAMNPGDSSTSKALWSSIGRVKEHVANHMNSPLCSVCIAACRCIQTFVVTLTKESYCPVYQNTFSTSYLRAASFNVDSIPLDHLILKPKELESDATNLLFLLLRKMNQTAIQLSASVITSIFMLLCNIVRVRTQHTDAIVDALVYFHCNVPELLSKTQRQSVRHSLRLSMSTITKYRIPGRWNDILRLCLEGRITRRGGKRFLDNATTSSAKLVLPQQTVLGRSIFIQSNVFNPAGPRNYSPNVASENLSELQISAQNSLISAKAAANENKSITGASSRIGGTELTLEVGSEALCRIINNIMSRISPTFVLPSNVYPIFSSLARFASKLDFEDKALLKLQELVKVLFSSQFTAQSGKTLLMIWIYSEYEQCMDLFKGKIDVNHVDRGENKDSVMEVDDPADKIEKMIVDEGGNEGDHRMNEDRDKKPKDDVPSNRYEHLISDAVQFLRDVSDANLLSTIVLGLPLLLPKVYDLINYFLNSNYTEIGLEILRDLILQRPPCRIRALDILLTQTASLEKEIRSKALEYIVEVYQTNSTSNIINKQAQSYLEAIREKAQLQETEKSNDGGSNVQFKKEDIHTLVKACISLPLAISSFCPSILLQIAELYNQSPPEWRLAISLYTCKNIKDPESPALLDLIANCPQGAENLIVAIIENSTPSDLVVQTIMNAFDNGTLKDATLIISIIQKLTPHQLLRTLPKIVTLPLARVKTALNRLFTSGVPLVPEELLLNLNIMQVDRGAASRAISICFDDGLLRPESLTRALQQLVTITPVPDVLMKTIILTLTHFPILQQEVVTILIALIRKHIWESNVLWHGFILACVKALPLKYNPENPIRDSIDVLMQLPADKLAIALENEKLMKRLMDVKAVRGELPKAIRDAIQLAMTRIKSKQQNKQ